MHIHETHMKEQQFRELTDQFQNYREMNDLDAYFAKNLSKESRERVVNNVKSLMKATDWY